MKTPTFLQNFFYQHRKKKCGLTFPLYCKAHGVKSADRQGAVAQSRANDPLQLVHSPVEGYPFNVYVYSITLNRILGYLDPILSEKLVYLFKKDFCIDGQIENITGGPPEYKYFGCNLRIYETAELMKKCGDLSHLHG